jgi:lysophospholipase L1-like esterase
MTKRIMCFGDSLTWGWNPIESGIPIERYSKEKRWTGILASELGPEFEVYRWGGWDPLLRGQQLGSWPSSGRPCRLRDLA